MMLQKHSFPLNTDMTLFQKYNLYSPMISSVSSFMYLNADRFSSVSFLREFSISSTEEKSAVIFVAVLLSVTVSSVLSFNLIFIMFFFLSLYKNKSCEAL